MTSETKRIHDFLKALAAAPPDRTRDAAQSGLRADVAWHGPHPLNDAIGLDAFVEAWRPLRRAFPDLERRDDIMMSGRFKDADWISAAGHHVGTFAEDWLGIPATRQTAYVRFGEFHRLDGGRIAESYVMYDIIDLMRQAGVSPLPPSLGEALIAPGPAARDGLLFDVPDPVETAKTLNLVEAMLAGLGAYDGQTLASMGMKRFWSPAMLWHGPAGIGTTRGLDGFENHHQIPFLRAFPDRKGGNHKSRFADGLYAASTGWPSLSATHLGDDWLGTKATGKRIGMRVMDWWRREGDELSENWVLIDVPDLFLQFGIDLLPKK